MIRPYTHIFLAPLYGKPQLNVQVLKNVKKYGLGINYFNIFRIFVTCLFTRVLIRKVAVLVSPAEGTVCQFFYLVLSQTNFIFDVSEIFF